MAVGDPADRAGAREALRLWAPWGLGPAAWALHENVSLALVEWVCRSESMFVLHGVSAGALSIAAAGVWIASRSLSEVRQGDPVPRRRERARFMALGGLLICVLSLAGIAVESIPNLMVDACTGAHG